MASRDIGIASGFCNYVFVLALISGYEWAVEAEERVHFFE